MYGMELLPNDVQILIYRMIHRFQTLTIHVELFRWLEWDETRDIYKYSTYSCQAANWRVLSGHQKAGCVFSINKVFKSYHKRVVLLPRRYVYSNGW